MPQIAPFGKLRLSAPRLARVGYRAAIIESLSKTDTEHSEGRAASVRQAQPQVKRWPLCATQNSGTRNP